MSKHPTRERDVSWNRGWRRLTRLWRADTANNVDDELQFHFEQKVTEFEERGKSPAEARRLAEQEFGDLQSVRNSLNEIDKRVAERRRRAEWWEHALQDLRYVMRSLARSRVFTATVVVTMALGLGANAAIFSLLSRLYLQSPAGMTNADQVTRLYQRFPNRGEVMTRMRFAFPEVRAVREAAPAGVQIAAYGTSRTRLGRDGLAPEVGAALVEGDYFRVAGIQPSLGRFFSPDEYRIQGSSMVAVISHSLWQRAYNSDPNILGKTLDLAAHRHVIVGVAAAQFRGFDLDVTDVWVPLNTRGNLKSRAVDWYESKNSMSNAIVARIPDDATGKLFETRAAEAMRVNGVITDTLATTFRGSLTGTLDSQGKSGELNISTRLGGVAVLILLIACANVINLLLSRVNERRREIAVRLALGVSRARLISQLLSETIVLALLSSGVALFVAHTAGTTLRRLLLPDIQWGTAVVDVRLALFTIVLALASGLLVGLVPAIQYSRPNLSNSLKSTGNQGSHRQILRSASLVAQTSLSVLLLAGAGIFVRSLQSVEAVNIGFDSDQLIFATIEHDRELENRSEEVLQKLPEVAERIRLIPGVEGVALSATTPMYDIAFLDLFLPDRDSLPPSKGAERSVSIVDPGFFRTAGIRILRGRDFESTDLSGAEPVVAVSELFARNLWPGEDPMTKCLIVSKRESPCRRVVAVVAATHFNQVIEGESMQFYVPLKQMPKEWSPRVIAIRATEGRTAAIRPLIEREIRAAYGTWARPVTRLMSEYIGKQLRPWRMGATLFTAAGLLALLVAAVGVYSSISYTISQRTQEMGVRVALGANSGNIMRLVIRESVGVVAIGVTAGLLSALALGKLVASMLYETSPRDPAVLGAATLTLLAVALVASAIPAWRASRVDPLAALRAE